MHNAEEVSVFQKCHWLPQIKAMHYLTVISSRVGPSIEIYTTPCFLIAINFLVSQPILYNSSWINIVLTFFQIYLLVSYISMPLLYVDRCESLVVPHPNPSLVDENGLRFHSGQ